MVIAPLQCCNVAVPKPSSSNPVVRILLFAQGLPLELDIMTKQQKARKLMEKRKRTQARPVFSAQPLFISLAMSDD